ncbi:MAG TPA: EF-hand domain-containing protein [Dyella sp.]|uniref:EF-hand domain-containing protein n=1 Tax=Dyella sp. TaxID=1869338 RepID=UPI002F9488B4
MLSSPAKGALLTIVLALTAGCASSGGRMAQKAQERFTSADTNQDGYLSRDEAQRGMPRLAEHFDEIDTDRDGRLSKAEILAYVQQRRAAR